MRRVLALAAVLALVPGLGFTLETVELLTTEYEPFCGVKGDTLWCDLVNAGLAREGITVQWRSFPQEREKALVAEGLSIAFLSGTLSVSAEEQQSFLMNPDPMIYASIVAFYPRAKYPKGLGIRGPADLKGKTVGVLQGTGSVIVHRNAGVDIDATPNKDLLIKKMVAGPNDIAVIADLTGLGSLRALFPDEVDAYAYELVYNSPIDLIFSRKNPRAADLMNRYNAGMAEIKADGTFMRILERYYPKGMINRSILPKDMR